MKARLERVLPDFSPLLMQGREHLKNCAQHGPLMFVPHASEGLTRGTWCQPVMSSEQTGEAAGGVR